MKPIKEWIHMPTLAVAATSLGAEILGVVYGFYYVKIFLNRYELDPKWLNVAQVCFLVWNAINDPMFGFMQDFGCGPFLRWIRVRRKVVLYCGPIYALSFMLFWFPWTIGNPGWLVGLHLLTALFMFDALVSLVLSAQCGMFTELTTNHKGRVRVVVYMEIANLIGSLAIFPIDKISKNSSDFLSFQITCGVLTVISALCFFYTGWKAPREIAQIQEQPMSLSKEQEAQEQMTFKRSMKDSLKSGGQIFTDRDFLSVIAGNFFHILRLIADANFLNIFVEALISPNGILPLGSTQLSLFYQACTTLPKVLLMVFWPLLQRIGAWSVAMVTLVLSVVNCTAAYFIGRHAVVPLAVFFLTENILARCTWPAVYNVFFPDIIDEDMKRHKRNSPISTTIFTLNALITKPAISISPIIIVAFLSAANYKSYEVWERDHLRPHAINATTLSPTPLPPAEADHLFDTMFLVAVAFPAICAVAEALALAPYRLKFRHRRRQSESECSPSNECSKL